MVSWGGVYLKQEKIAAIDASKTKIPDIEAV